MDAPITLTLNRGLTPDAWRPVFRAHRRLHIPDVLDPASARALHALLTRSNDWTRSIHAEGGKDVDIYVRELEALDAEQRAALERSLIESSTDSVRYVFDTIRVTSELNGGRPVPRAIQGLHAFVNGPAFLDFARRLTGDDRIAFADVMATRYQIGHFATAHQDALPDHHRLYAYVLNLTPQWKADWGGLLMFLDEDGHVAEGYTPRFNALNVFAVPQTHSVSAVSRLAQAPRLSITGWLHAAG